MANVRPGCWVVAAVFAAASGVQAQPMALGSRYAIPTDAAARYTNIAIDGAGRYRKITTRREGKSGTLYSRRKYDCERWRVRYLASADTLDGLKHERPDKWADVVDRSIADYVGTQACHGYLEKSQPAR